ncbi:hypothetical protein YW5DRAFT_01908 [Streptomyces sp. Ncost-T6T-1]|uniref:hypothetical protein n=1 Tax=Streptomyces sp. Ncost-T6T-1 TaxID=1100828 RepID=UPI000805FDB2|nr:hypothetical protein [Streptomyces sp. Ncost-T6T-1]SBV00576.1 hypothetical protein YW5DRAFT_01908 [Streptomyces sp. Ncost-T6T-1]
MAIDALDPGEDGTYPHFPRDKDGRPLWSDHQMTDGQPVDGQAPMPRGIRRKPVGRGNVVTIDVTPTGPNGQPINPPDLPPAA